MFDSRDDSLELKLELEFEPELSFSSGTVSLFLSTSENLTCCGGNGVAGNGLFEGDETSENFTCLVEDDALDPVERPGVVCTSDSVGDGVASPFRKGWAAFFCCLGFLACIGDCFFFLAQAGLLMKTFCCTGILTGPLSFDCEGGVDEDEEDDDVRVSSLERT